MQARVLIVDDEPATRAQVRRILQREGCDTDVAAEGLEALDALRDREYDLVISDFCMPEMDGVTLLQQSRAQRPEMAALLMTAWPDERVEEAGLDVLLKPFTRRELRESMRLALTCPVRLADHARNDTRIPAPGTRFVLRDHSWARVERNGLVTIGVEPAFARHLVGLQSATLCRELEDLAQWETCARLHLGEGGVELVRAPVSFRVVRINWSLVTDPWSIVHDPLRSGWLCAGTPLQMNRDVRALDVIGPDGTLIAEEEPR